MRPTTSQEELQNKCTISATREKKLSRFKKKKNLVLGIKIKLRENDGT